MTTVKYLSENYKRFLLNRWSVTPEIAESIESCVTKNEEEGDVHTFHKIMVHNWPDSLGQLFDVISTYFGSFFVPVNCTSQGEITTFYTENLNIIVKIIKFDFMFPYCRNMFNIDVLFNDRSSTDFFGHMITIEDIVSGVVCQRFTEKCELDLSSFCEDKEFVSKKIWFYKLDLLKNFRILMLRMGRDTKKLTLKNNHLSQSPVDLLNFFLKADLTAIDLSNNEIPSLQELRLSSKIEKLWLEGNPLCEELDPMTYVKNVSMKFPRLIELDGIKVNQHGLIVPFFRNYLATPDRKTQIVVEEFVDLYFTNFDGKKGQKRVKPFYEQHATLTIACDFNESENKLLPHYGLYYRNMINPYHKKRIEVKSTTWVHQNQDTIMEVFSKWPETTHDKSTFTVDVLCHNKKVLMLVVDGMFKELVGPGHPTENIFRFRRTFIFNIYPQSNMTVVYNIQHEMINVRFATLEQLRHSFTAPIVNMNSLTPIAPTSEEIESISRAFQHLTQLKKTEVHLRLVYHGWNLQAALRDFMDNMRDHKVPADRFIEEEDLLSDGSSILDELD